MTYTFFPEARCWLVRELMWVWGCRLRLWLRVCESGQRCQCGWVRGFGWVRRLCLSQVDKFLSESDPMPSPSKHAKKVWKLTAFRTVNVGCTSRAGNEQWGRRNTESDSSQYERQQDSNILCIKQLLELHFLHLAQLMK